MTFPYPTEGWDVSSVSPSDTALTLRGLGRRFGAAASRLPSSGRAGPAGAAPSVQDQAGAIISGADSSLRAITDALGQALIHEGPSVDLPPLDARGPPSRPTLPSVAS